MDSVPQAEVKVTRTAPTTHNWCVIHYPAKEQDENLISPNNMESINQKPCQVLGQTVDEA